MSELPLSLTGRPVSARWTFTAMLEMKTAAQIGSHDSDYCDQTFARDANGRAMLPGATLAGALRNALADRLSGYGKAEEPLIQALFGTTEELKPSKSGALAEVRPWAGEGAHESPVITFDSVALETAVASVRNGVRIEPKTGLANEDGFKYDREVSVAGDRFPIRVDLIIPCSEIEIEWVGALVTALDGLAAGEIRFGARKTRGMGECLLTSPGVDRYDLTKAEEWRRYARSEANTTKLIDANTSQTGAENGKKFADIANNAWNPFQSFGMRDERKRVSIECHLRILDTLMMRTPGDVADAVHLHEGRTTQTKFPWLTGTGVAGALRAHALKILQTLHPPVAGRVNPYCETLVSNLFGPAPEELKNGGIPRSSRFENSETTVESAGAYRQTRIKVDRFTGAPVDGAFLEEEPIVGGTVKFTLAIREPKESEIGLLLLIVRDLIGGLLPVGGGASIGRGILAGTAFVTLPNGKTVSLPDALTDSQTVKELDQQYMALLLNGDAK